ERELACHSPRTAPGIGAARPSTVSWRRPTRGPWWIACSGMPTSRSPSSPRKGAGASSASPCRRGAVGGCPVATSSRSPSSWRPSSRPACRSTVRWSSRPSWRRALPSAPSPRAWPPPRPSSRLYVNMVRAGEKGGALEATLRRLAEFLEESGEFRDAIVSALIYPALLAGVGAAAVIFLLSFVVPRFAAIFSDVEATLPLPTLILLRVSEAIQRHGWLLGILALAAFVALRLALATPAGRLRADRLLLALPIVGDVI